jgi:AraC-like DNA-binding protein
MLSDPENTHSVVSIAGSLCFGDASSFSRAFRREFGHSPSDVKFAAMAGIPLSATRPRSGEPKTHRFADLLAPVGHSTPKL